MGRWKLLRASKFNKLPAQLASIDFSQSFTPEKGKYRTLKCLSEDLIEDLTWWVDEVKWY